MGKDVRKIKVLAGRGYAVRYPLRWNSMIPLAGNVAMYLTRKQLRRAQRSGSTRKDFNLWVYFLPNTRRNCKMVQAVAEKAGWRWRWAGE